MVIKQIIKKNDNFFYYIFSLFIILFLIITNQYISVESASLEGWVDQIFYFHIVSNAPNLPTIDIPDHHAQRFLFPFIIGTFIKLFDLVNYTHISFIIINIIILYIITFTLLKINTFICHSKLLAIIFASAFFLNPYFSRVALYAPFQINDYIFSLSFLFLIRSILRKERFVFLLCILICSLSRQTTIFLLPTLFAISLFFLWKKEKSFINLRLSLFSIIIFIFSFSLTKILSYNFSIKLDSYLTLLLGFSYQASLIEWIYFLSRILIGNAIIFSLIGLCLINYKKIIKPLKFKNEIVIIFLITISTWIQPLLAGVQFTGGNIIRLTVLTNVGLFISVILALNQFYISKINAFCLLLILFVISFFHKSSIFTIVLSHFESARFGILILFFSVIFFLLSLKLLKSNKI